MAEQAKPIPPKQAPDPARTYERAKPEAEPGMGDLDQKPATPAQAPDHHREPRDSDKKPQS